MSNKELKHALNVKGAWYCTHPDDDDGCIECGLCYGAVPEFFAEDEDGNAYIFKQPITDEEQQLCQEQLEDCPVCSIGKDGE